MNNLCNDKSDLKDNYDVVVIGSGYGGAVSALRMAEAGYSVCILERGKQFEPEDFPDTVLSALKQLKVSGHFLKVGNDQALLDCRLGKDINVIVGNGVGGGSLINAAVTLRPDADLFLDESWPNALREPHILDESFARSEQMLETTHCPETTNLKKYKALQRSGQELDSVAEPVPMAISFADRKNAFGVDLKKCQGCGDCWVGCKSGSKNSLDKNYLPAALSHQAEIYAGCAVDYVAQSGAGEWTIYFTDIEPERKKDYKTLTVRANKVVIAAGTLGSTEILLRSKQKGLKISDRLGQGFSGNGDYLAYGYGNKEKTNAIATGINNRDKTEFQVGPAATGMITIKGVGAQKHDFIIQDGTFLSILTGSLVSMNLMKGHFRDAAKNMVKGAYQGTFANMQTYYVVSRDNAEGQMKLDKDQLRIEWENITDQPSYRDVDEVLEKAAGADGGDYHKNPLSDNIVFGRKPITVHPMGGCAMGDSFEDGVVNHKCQVFSGEAQSDQVYKGLYVCDGSVIPLSLGVNPLLTITALAEYAMSHIDGA